jgi:hypothetical protein
MLSELIHNQTVDHSNVVAHQKWGREGRFHLVSCAGHIIYKPTSEKDAARFRDRWINRFETIRQLMPQDQRPAFFRLFKEIRDTEKIKFKANARTRLCYLNPLS